MAQSGIFIRAEPHKREKQERKPLIIQTFLKEKIFDAGISEIKYNHSDIRIYDRDRMLIELLRFRSRTPMDYDKEIINHYRILSSELDFAIVEEYIAMLKSSSKVYPFAVWILFIHLRLRKRKKHHTHLMIWSIFSMV